MSTIKDVAKYAGVSIATVSRVINNIPNVKPETVQKVNDAIEACNFVPNLVARNLKSEQTRTIGFLISDIANSYFSTMAKDLELLLQKEGYEMMICSTDDDPAMERSYLKQFLSNQVVGIILNTTGKNNDFIKKISKNTPVVLIERSIPFTSFSGDFIGANNRAGIFNLATHLLKLGHRKIGIINGNLNVSTGQERYLGFIEAMAQYDISIQSDYPLQYNANSFLEHKGYEAVEYLLSQPQTPTALIITNNTLSIGALKYLKQHKVRIPEDISIMCYGNIENSELFFVDPAYTTLDPHTIAQKAYDYIITRINQSDLPNRETIFESNLYLGESVAPPKC